MQSPFAVWMDRFLLERPDELAPDEEDVQKQLIAGEGDKHERAYLDRLLSDGVALVEIDKKKDFTSAAADTVAAIRSKTPVIYQAALQSGNFAGFADFLVLDQHGEYEIRDTKLGRSPKPYYLMQLCCYAQLLAEITGTISAAISVVMVSGRERLRISGEPIELRQFRTADYWFYYLRLKDAFLKLMADFRPDMTLRPIPGARSDHGHWQSYADKWSEETDHLSRVARITVGQIKKLESAGIRTLAALANSGNDAVARLSDETRMKLVQQARRVLPVSQEPIGVQGGRKRKTARIETCSCCPGKEPCPGPLIGREAIARKIAAPRGLKQVGRKPLDVTPLGGGLLDFPQARRHFTQSDLFCNNRPYCSKKSNYREKR
jgi:uncharacterized protein